jgi:hypothetical protein
MFGSTSYGRKQILSGLRFVVRELRALSVETIWIDGSYVTSKLRPGDVDVLYDPNGMDNSGWGLLSPARRLELKKLQRVDLWAHPSPQPRGFGLGSSITLHDLWATDRSDIPKGMLLLEGGIDD